MSGNSDQANEGLMRQKHEGSQESKWREYEKTEEDMRR